MHSMRSLPSSPRNKHNLQVSGGDPLKGAHFQSRVLSLAVCQAVCAAIGIAKAGISQVVAAKEETPWKIGNALSADSSSCSLWCATLQEVRVFVCF